MDDSVNEERESKEPNQKAREVLKRFHKASSAEQKDRDIWRMGFEYLNNRVGGELGQWDPSVKAQLGDKPALTFPEFRKFINRLSGAQRLTKLDEKCFPRDSDSDPIVAEINTDLLKYVYDLNDADGEIAQAFRNCLVGRGWVKAEWSDELDATGEITIRSVHPRCVYIVGKGYRYDLSDVAVIEKITMTEDQLKARYPDQWDQIVGMKAGATDTVPQSQGNDYDYTQLGDFYDKDEGEYFILREQRYDYEVAKFLKDPESGRLIPLETEDIPKGIKTVNKSVKKVKVTVVCGDVLLEEKYSDAKHGMFDLVPFFAYFDDGLPTGVAQDLIDAQDEKNKRRSQMTHILGMIAKGNFFYKEGAFDDAEEVKKLIGGTGNLIPVKTNIPTRDAIVPIPVDVTLFPTLAQMDAMSSQEMKEISGLQDAAMGKLPEGVQSGVAIQSLQMPVEVIMGEMVENYLRSRRMLARIVLSLIQQYYTEERRVRILGDYQAGFVPDEMRPMYDQIAKQALMLNPTLTPEEAGQMAATMIDIQNGAKVVTINKQVGVGKLLDVTAGRYDVVIDHVSQNPTTRRALLFDLMNLRSMAVPIPNRTLLEFTDIPNKRRVIADMENEQAQLVQQAAAAQMQEAQSRMASPTQSSQMQNVAGGQMPMVMA